MSKKKDPYEAFKKGVKGTGDNKGDHSIGPQKPRGKGKSDRG
jgi:hypothetical protein